LLNDVVSAAELSFDQSAESTCWIKLSFVFIYAGKNHHFSGGRMSHPACHDYGFMQRDYLVPIPKAWVVGERKRSFRKRNKTFPGKKTCFTSGFFTCSDMLLNPAAARVCWNWSGKVLGGAVEILYRFGNRSYLIIIIKIIARIMVIMALKSVGILYIFVWNNRFIKIENK
jgi:hypothetical protein